MMNQEEIIKIRNNLRIAFEEYVKVFLVETKVSSTISPTSAEYLYWYEQEVQEILNNFVHEVDWESVIEEFKATNNPQSALNRGLYGSKPKQETKTMTFEEYLVEAEQHNVIDFRIRASIMDTHTEFYIHPIDKNGKTLTFKVEGNSLTLTSETGEFESIPKEETKGE